MGRSIDQSKHAAILKTAVSKFLDLGFSIAAIARHVCVSKVTIYNQFGGKGELFQQAVTLKAARLKSEMSFVRYTGPFQDQLREFGQAMQSFFANPRLVKIERRLAVDVAYYSAISEPVLDAVPRHVVGLFANLLSEAQEKNLISFPDLEQAANQLALVLMGISGTESRFGHSSLDDETAAGIDGAVGVFLCVCGSRKYLDQSRERGC